MQTAILCVLVVHLHRHPSPGGSVLELSFRTLPPCVQRLVRNVRKAGVPLTQLNGSKPFILPASSFRNTMQDKLIQVQAQPFFKLAQANMDLFTRFSTSPEVTTQASANASQLFQQASESAMKLMQSNAFAHLMEGMLKNYTEFLGDVSQSGAALLSQGQAAMTHQVQEATHNIIEATETRGRRERQAA